MSRHEQITIQGNPFRVPMRYHEGHTLSQNEADALNQTLHENLRNIWSPKVKKALETGEENLEALQAEFDRYAAEYQFGVRRRPRGAQGATEPVEGIALNMARDLVRKAVKSKGLDWSTSKITEAARQLLERQGPEGPLMQAARQRAEAERMAGQTVMEDIEGLLYQQQDQAA